MTAKDRFDALVSGYLDDAIDAEGAAELSALLASRPDCARRFARLSRLHGCLRELQAGTLPAGASEEQALEAWLAPLRARRRLRFAWLIAVAATLLALFLLAVFRLAR
jgi:anti-sigma factor RsiW